MSRFRWLWTIISIQNPKIKNVRALLTVPLHKRSQMAFLRSLAICCNFKNGQFWVRLRGIHSGVWLALLTFFLTITVFPVLASDRPIISFPVVSFASKSSFSGRSLGKSAFPGRSLGTSQTNLLEGGITLYEAGRFSEAADIWQKAARNYQAQGDVLNQALSLSYLSLAYQDLGNWEEAKRAIASSLALLQGRGEQLFARTSNQQKTEILARSLNTQGNLQLALGQPETALETWQKAEAAYAQVNDQAGVLGSQINQIQALQTMGLYRRAEIKLNQINQSLQAQPNSLLKAAGLRSLGEVLQVVGNLSQSQKVLQESLAIASSLNFPIETSATLFSLGNTLRALQKPKEALSFYQQAAEVTPNTTQKLRAQLNQLSLLIETEQWETAQTLLPQIQSGLVNLSPSRMAVYARVNLAENLIKLSALSAQSSLFNSNQQLKTDIAKLLAIAIQQARELQDARAQSYALGQLGKLYEQTQQWVEAQNLTEQALILAQTVNADDIAYRWQWQLGRILKQKAAGSGSSYGDAIASYTQAVNTLQSLRRDLLAINKEIQFSFRASVEPIYRELIALLLQSDQPSQQNLKQAREAIEGFQLAELENFFRSACLDIQPSPIDKIDAKAAVIYPIILPERLAVIVSLPNQPLSYYATSIPQKEVENVLEQALQSLNPAFGNKERLQLSQQVYNWLLKPAETALASSNIKTLVFVLDGALRNLPMAALYDGQKYLLEKYSLALTPGLQLLKTQSLKLGQLRAFLGGLTEARQGFSALPGVESELTQISSKVSSEVFLNQEFTATNLQNQLTASPFPVIHLATHGQFSSNLEETFILTWDSRINLQNFNQLLQVRQKNQDAPIELLVLSACQTAEGDKRATLGLAGLAVRSGARSTLATLWAVQDESTAKFMTEFYRELNQVGVSKAEALRLAQLSLLQQEDYKHPFYWAPFVLVGNWL